MTAETSNYVRVAPSPGDPATGNGNRTGSADSEPNAQPRAGARARGAESVTKAIAVVRDKRVARRVELVPAGEESDRPDLWRRSPVPLSTVWERAWSEVGRRWTEGENGERAIAAALLVFAVFSVAVSGLAYGIAFSAQSWPRALWLAVAIAAGVAFLLAGGPAAAPTP